jgi:hypothetical protein
MKKLAYLVSVSALLFACRSDEGGVTPGGADAPPAVGSTKVSDVQGTGVALDAAVTLKGVVVTAIDKFGTRTGNVFVADPAGGPFSGVLVVGASAVQVDALAVGDIVTVDGAKKAEFALTADMSGRTTTELVAATGGMLTITKTGTGTVPAPAVVDAQAIAALDEAGRTVEWEKWEGVLIKVVNVAAQTAPRAIGGSMPDPTFQDFGITGGIKVDSSQAAFPDVLAGDCLASVTGVGDYFFNYKIVPRATADVVGGGTGCPAQETGPTACKDGLDNDLDGFKDCTDNSCISDPTSTCGTVATVVDVQTGVATGVVNIANAFVTGRALKGLWVADALAAANNNGVFVFTGAAPAADLVIGASVKVSGEVTEFDVGNPQDGDKLTEIKTATVTLLAAAGPEPTALVVTAAVAGDILAGEPTEGVLISIPTLKVSIAGNVTTLTANDGKTIVLSKDAFAVPAQTAGACVNVTGLGSLALGPNLRSIAPRSTTDITTGTGCN